MRKRVYRISEDRFTDVMPEYNLPSALDLTCYTGEVFSGVLSFSVSEGQSMRGVVYCDSHYVHIEQPTFEGESVDIAFTVPDVHVKSGEFIQGKFTVVAVGLEQDIPFKIVYKDALPCLSDGTVIESLNQFASLCQVRFNEAATLFYSESFGRFVSALGTREALLYKAYSKALVSQANVDEFLVSLGLKESMTFDVNETTDTYYSVSENVRGTVEITRSTWGYIDVEVKCDSDFVTVEREHITSDFFLGSVFAMHYYIHASKLHAGNNLAKITFDYNGIHKEVIVMASTKQKGVVEQFESRVPRLALSGLKKLYMEYRFHRMTTAAWASDSLKILEGIDIDPEDVNVMLYKALIFITSHRTKEAAWIIMDLKKTIADRHGAQFAMLLYLSALLEPQEDFVNEVTAQVEEIYTKYTDDIMVFWCLCYLREEYIKNPAAKFSEVLSKISKYPSPIIFVEAYEVLSAHPYMISELSNEILTVLRWCIRKKVFSEDMAMALAQATSSYKFYDEAIFEVLKAAYELYPTDSMLLALVSFLLKSSTVRVADHRWYVLALEADLKIAGVFEAYVNSMEKNSREVLPKVLLMFFKYNNALSFERKALLYADILEHRMDDAATYNEYKDIIERFTVEMLKSGLIDDNLALCYSWLMDIGIVDESSARSVESLVFRRRVSTNVSNANRALCFSEQYGAPFISDFTDGVAYIRLVDDTSIVLVEDKNGILYASKKEIDIEKIINFEASVMDDVRGLAPMDKGLILRDIMERQVTKSYDGLSDDSIMLFLNDESIAVKYKRSLYADLISYMRGIGRGGVVLGYFMRSFDYRVLSEDAVAALASVAIDEGRFDLAWELVTKDNGQAISLEDIHRLCHYKVSSGKIENEPDDTLLILCAACAQKESVSDSMADYLARFFVGATELMILIYERAKNASASYVELAERILIQSLYRGFMPSKADAIFMDYSSRKNNKLVVDAYLNFAAHDYLINETKGSELIFSVIYDRYRRGRHLGESMRIALLKFLVLYETPSEENLEVLDEILGDSILRGQYFGFYERLSYEMQVKYHLYDKYFVEYHDAPEKSLYIAYSINAGEEIKKELGEMYDGIYVKPFTLFFGDTLSYVISDEEGWEKKNERIDFLPATDSARESRFTILGEINKGILYDDSDLLRALKRYQGLSVVADKLFTEI